MIIILGSDGMLGREFLRLYGERAKGLSRKDCDFTDFSVLNKLLDANKCSLIINCAAVIDISYIEKFEDKSFAVNALLPFNIAKYCSRRGCSYIHISSDHFYLDEQKKHSETFPVSLVNKYAEQKFIAEQLVLQAYPKSLVIRTSIIGCKNLDGKTFIEWILKTIKYEKEINGFYDAITSSIDINSFCINVEIACKKKLSGIYNIATREPYSKYNLIEAIISNLSLRDVKLNKKSVRSLTVKRANACGLDCEKFQKETGVVLPDMKETLTKINLEKIYNEI
ncbi:MAG: dTDP-4-dehydrorhamnose reductase family protein [Porticoccaceae bacterium]